MAKQVGPLFITGTIDGIIFYKLNDTYYMRSKGDYKSAKMMRRDPRLKRTMEKANQFGAASKIVKDVYYRYLPKEIRKHGLFGKLTGMVNRWLQKGKSKEEAREALLTHCQGLVTASTTVTTTQVISTVPTLIANQTPTTKSSSVKPSIERPVKTPTHGAKQARYLSRWKVNPNGRLHIPKRTGIVKPRFTAAKKK